MILFLLEDDIILRSFRGVLSTDVEMILTKNGQIRQLNGILHVCGDDPKSEILYWCRQVFSTYVEVTYRSSESNSLVIGKIYVNLALHVLKKTILKRVSFLFCIFSRG